MECKFKWEEAFYSLILEEMNLTHNSLNSNNIQILKCLSNHNHSNISKIIGREFEDEDLLNM